MPAQGHFGPPDAVQASLGSHPSIMVEVIVLSNGCDRGNPEVLGEHMDRLFRVACRLVWVNPLKASLGYTPLAGGRLAALPWLDEFVGGLAVSWLESLGRMLSTTATGRRAA